MKLLFFKQKDVLNKLSAIRGDFYKEIESRLTNEDFEEWIERDVNYWIPPYQEEEDIILKSLNKAFLWNKYPSSS